jgi:hypothetical protein
MGAAVGKQRCLEVGCVSIESDVFAISLRTGSCFCRYYAFLQRTFHAVFGMHKCFEPGCVSKDSSGFAASQWTAPCFRNPLCITIVCLQTSRILGDTSTCEEASIDSKSLPYTKETL